MNYEEDETYDYKLTKEYNWNVKNKASKGYEENFFFCYRPGHGELFTLSIGCQLYITKTM